MDKEKFLEEVAKVAYERYEQRGRHDGYAMDDWLEAERVVLTRHSAEVTQEAAAIRAKGKTEKARKAAPAASKPAAAKKTAAKVTPAGKKTAKKTVAKKR